MTQEIYNMDKTGLFFKTSGDQSFYVKGEKCGGGKKSKERITVSVCANQLGEKDKLLVIGKSARPRASSSVDIAKLPVVYKHNRKAWMTTDILTAWVRSLNEKMTREGRFIHRSTKTQ